MCKFCESKKEKKVLSFDNCDYMNICYGQYQGVNVVASLFMKGNMLTLHGSGSYRSASDCYYEDKGIECYNENSSNSPGSYIKIEYCPFCGRKLDSNEFEAKKNKDEIETLKCKLKTAKDKLYKANLFAWFSFVAKEDDLYNRAKELLWDDFSGDVKILPIRLETILKEFGNIKVHMKYGLSNEDERYHYIPCPVFNPNEGIKFDGSSFGEFHGRIYSITDEQYDTLVDMGLIKRNTIKVDGVRNKKAKIQKEIDKLNNKLISLQKN